MKLLIKNGLLINPATNICEEMDVLVNNDKIERIAKNILEECDRNIDAKGMWVIPGLIDVHVHLRDPGFTHKETIATGTRSAAMGGFTTICCMPNTDPVTDSEIIVEYINMKAKRDGVVNVLPIGAITKGQKGEELANIGQMSKAGACALSEDGKTVTNAGLLKTAMKYAAMFNLPILSHCEDKTLAGSGVINSGKTSQLLGLNGISNDSEDVIVARDIILAKSAGIKLHICHVSTAGSIELVRQARLHGDNVTCEITPHHFTLCDEDITNYDTNFKMNPPLRSKADLDAVRAALKDDTATIIATDHAPHSADDKNCEYDRAAFGIVGLETSLALGITELVNGKWLTPSKLIEKMTINPAKLLGIDKGNIDIGKTADIAIVDPSIEYAIDINSFASKSKNSPFDGRKVNGKVLYTIVNGNIIVDNGILLGGEK